MTKQIKYHIVLEDPRANNHTAKIIIMYRYLSSYRINVLQLNKKKFNGGARGCILFDKLKKSTMSPALVQFFVVDCICHFLIHAGVSVRLSEYPPGMASFFRLICKQIFYRDEIFIEELHHQTSKLRTYNNLFIYFYGFLMAAFNLIFL